jgi:hypothetical protein
MLLLVMVAVTIIMILNFPNKMTFPADAGMRMTCNGTSYILAVILLVFHSSAGLLSDDPPALGSIHRGVVHTVKPFGVFIRIEGYRKHVLVHHSQVSCAL